MTGSRVLVVTTDLVGVWLLSEEVQKNVHLSMDIKIQPHSSGAMWLLRLVCPRDKALTIQERLQTWHDTLTARTDAVQFVH
jgi:hypothetical protein